MPRGQSETTSLCKQLIYEWAEHHKPVTALQLFYRLSTLDAVPKTEAGYKMVSRLCTLMRQNQEIPYEWFADNSRRISEKCRLGQIWVCKVFVTFFVRIAEDAEDTEGGFGKMKSFVRYLLHVRERSTIKDECATSLSIWLGGEMGNEG